MRVLAIVHEEAGGPGVFLDVIDRVGVTLEVWEPPHQPGPPAAAEDYDALISLGGTANPDQVASHPWITTELAVLAGALKTGKPTLGICLGAQLLAEAAGTRTRAATVPEIGWYKVKLTRAADRDPLFAELPAELVTTVRLDSFAVRRSFEALEWHTYEVPLPDGATALASSDNCLQAYRIGSCAWGIQSHPEVTARDFSHWIQSGSSDPSFTLLGIDADDLQSETDAKLEHWHELGRTLAQRFLDFTSRRGRRDSLKSSALQHPLPDGPQADTTADGA